MTPTDGIKKCDGALISGQHQMIAVVDRQPQRRLEIRSAPATRMPRQLVHDNLPALAHELNSRRQAGETSPDDMRRPGDH
jgi:hypothetical protein